ncbi:MFS transporter [Pseudomonas sp. MSSRFD41]|uniref:MFS transporter n=1 Tax=unclassified Pseudomonas TaxID=196821 RepID=UPI00163A42C0|nr:MFS transporter [Pseudomonas sp. MSSRFD41]MBC2657867.1 MFS transporter [Pseudomonas sp. MSSRFD41]
MSIATARPRALIMALLMAVMVISVLDKTIFAFAGVQIIEELQLTPEQFGFVGSAFFFLYSISGIAVGFLANRYPTRWILTFMALVWTSAQLLVTFAGSLAALTASRLLLGAGCGPGTAVTQHAAFKWFGTREQVLPASLIQVSIMLGGLLGALALPYAISHYGWRSAYLGLALLSLGWVLAWLYYGAEGRHDERPEQMQPGEPTVSYRHLLLNRTFVWISLMCFVAYLPNALSFSWSAVYLQKGLGLDPMQTGYVMFAATFGIILLNLLVSGLSQWLLKRGVSVQHGLVLLPMLCCMFGGLALSTLGSLFNALEAKLLLYVAGAVLLNSVFAFGMTITSYISPTRQRGAMLAIHVGCMTMSGMLAPWLVGKLVVLFDNDIAQGFETALNGIGLTALACALLGLWVITPGVTRERLLARGHDTLPNPAPVQAA